MKKIILGIIIVVMCFVVVGCESTTIEGNKEFGEYTGIYKLKNMELKIVHHKNTILLMMNKDGESYGSTVVYLDGNKFTDLNCEFELKKDLVNIKSNQKDIPNGDYQRISEYTIEEIYKEYIGDISYIEKINFKKYDRIYI